MRHEPCGVWCPQCSRTVPCRTVCSYMSVVLHLINIWCICACMCDIWSFFSTIKMLQCLIMPQFYFSSCSVQKMSINVIFIFIFLIDKNQYLFILLAYLSYFLFSNMFIKIVSHFYCVIMYSLSILRYSFFWIVNQTFVCRKCLCVWKFLSHFRLFIGY